MNENKTDPPDAWFKGIGRKDRGILSIALQTESINGWDDEIEQAWNDYNHYHGNPGDPENEERKIRKQQAFETANTLMKQKLGFSADELNQQMSNLYDEYRGKNEARISFELY